MTPEEKSEQIYKHMRNFNAAEGAVSLLWHHNVGERDYWEEVWYELLLNYGEHWQAMQWDDEMSKEHYIEHVCP